MNIICPRIELTKKQELTTTTTTRTTYNQQSNMRLICGDRNSIVVFVILVGPL